MSDLFHDQLQALRAQSLHRKLREIGSAQGPEVRTVGQQLTNFFSNAIRDLLQEIRLRRSGRFPPSSENTTSSYW
jgi:7-keto-8-aminopelargonate synthetase-like enzyme